MKASSQILIGMFILFLSACGGGGSSVDSVNTDIDSGGTIGVTTVAPVADAGLDQNVATDSQVSLDGSGSSVSEGGALSYRWSLDSKPLGSNTSLSDPGSDMPSFTADVDGVYLISLIVNDGVEISSSDTVSITSSTSSTAVTRLAYAIVDTGQSLCYNSDTGQSQACSGTGYDADYAGNQPSYALSTDGLTVTDQVTGLIWQQSSDITGDGQLNSEDKLYQSEALSYCENLSLSDRDDWRLPSIKEVYSLILFSGKDPSGYQGSDTSSLIPFLDSRFDWAFGDLDSGERIIDGQYASSTLYLSTTMNGDATMFGVNFVDGRIKGYPTQFKEYYVRCVTDNSDYGSNDFVDNGDQTISDQATGLMWQQNDSETPDWDAAVAQCEAASTASHTDWRLVNAKELHSIVDYSRSPDTHNQPALDPVFNATSFVNEAGNIDWGYYWSSTTHVNHNDDGSNAAYLSFGRALGYMQGNVLDVHGAGAQRSNDKVDVSVEAGAQSATGSNGTFYYKGPQGDILRNNNKVRCVRDISSANIEFAEEFTLFAPLQSTETYLVDEQGSTVHSWQADTKPGLSVYLLENGELLRPGVVADTPSTFAGRNGGSAGLIEIFDWQSNLVWSASLATETYLSHHDVEQLPNGNILAVVWEAKPAAEALALGRSGVSGDRLWAGAVYEVCRASNSNNCIDGEIVWSWSIWDHLVQDLDSSVTSTYVSDVSAHPDKVDLNYFTGAGCSDWTHINSVDYNAATDQILLSVRNFSEYWVIDHSGSSRGLLSRVGNPAAYQGSGEQSLFVQHDAQWIESGLPGGGNILVFNNGANRPEGNYSSVDEFCYTGNNCTAGELVSRYSEGVTGSFYADHISGAQRLANGNTLVCEGTEGRFFEYNSSHEIVWELNYGEEVFRATRYAADYPGLAELN